LKRLAAIFAALFLSAPAAQAETMLVFDGSNSMWGELNGVPKIEIARDSINTFLDEWDPAEPLGLVAYGHREARSCTDIEVLAAPGATFGQIRRAVGGIFPQGRTPLTGAIISASRTLIQSDAKEPTIILLTDGVETCNQDPCEVARILKQNRVDFIAHVIGFQMSVRDQRSIACLAEETGGAFLTADDTNSLKLALVQVAQLVAAEERRDASLLSVSKTLAAQDPVSNVPLDDLLAAQEVESPVKLVSATVEPRPNSDGVDRDDPRRIITERVRETIAQSLNAETKAPEDTIPGTTVLAFGSARVSFGVSLAEGSPPEFAFAQPRWTIYGRTGRARGKQLVSSMANQPIFDLPIGDYVAVLEADNVMYNYGFSVKTTLPARHVIALNLGQLSLSIENDAIVDVYSFRFERGPSHPSVDMQIRGPWDQTFLLPRGTYIVQGRTGDRRLTVGPLSLEAGESVRASLTIE